MKKTLLLLAFAVFAGAFPLAAQETAPPASGPPPQGGDAEDPALTVPAAAPAPETTPALAKDAAPAGKPARRTHRIVELGFDVDAGYGNSLLALGDIFNVRRAVTLDFSRTRVDDFVFNAALVADLFINVNIGELSFGIFAGLEASGQAKAGNLLRFLREGNARRRDFSGEGSAGAAAFLEAGLSARFPVGRFRVTARPALYAPLFYVPPPEITYALRTEESGAISMDAVISADVYSAVSLENGLNLAALAGTGIPLGADLSAEVLWLFLPQLDLGVSVAHIPVVPAALEHRVRYRADPPYHWEESNLFGAFSGGGFSLPGTPDLRAEYSDGASFTAFRPLRLDLFAEYRPVAGFDIFVLRPVIGLSFLTPYGYDQVCFNFTLEGQVNIRRGFSASLSTGLDEWVWIHRLGLMFNLRAVELRAALSLRGTDFAGSWTGKGLGLALGMSFGW